MKNAEENNLHIYYIELYLFYIHSKKNECWKIKDKKFFPFFQPEPEFFRNNAATTSSSSEVHPNVQNGGSVNSTVEATAISVQTTSLLKGVLWQQREKRFSRWKERFFMLTNEYLQCFRKGTSKISEMGGFIYRIRLSEVRFFLKKMKFYYVGIYFVFVGSSVCKEIVTDIKYLFITDR